MIETPGLLGRHHSSACSCSQLQSFPRERWREIDRGGCGLSTGSGHRRWTATHHNCSVTTTKGHRCRDQGR